MSFYSNHMPEVIDAANEEPEADPRVRTARKPRPKTARSIRVLEQPSDDTDGWAAVAITVGKRTDTYLVNIIATQFGEGVTAFEVEKLDAELATIEQYHVCLSPRSEEQSCECLGFLRHGHCKHVDGLTALTCGRKL